MSCDIHNDKWVMVDRINGHEARERNYERFAALAGVRGEEPTARGLPEDISESAQMFVDEWEDDAHHHSWLPIKRMADIMLSTSQGLSDFDKEFPMYCFFKIENRFRKPDYHKDYRVIFFFDC